jgi:hypothetical protein
LPSVAAKLWSKIFLLHRRRHLTWFYWGSAENGHAETSAKRKKFRFSENPRYGWDGSGCEKRRPLIRPPSAVSGAKFTSVSVIVGLFIMGLMDVVVRAVVAWVIVVMYRGVSMIVSMFVFVAMLVAVGMGVFMGVRHVPVGVLVRMTMGMLVGMEMLVLMVALHNGLLSLRMAFTDQALFLMSG